MTTPHTPLITVILPIYNMERYLDECLESIAAQELSDFECVMVDDGSRDRSVEIAQRFADKDSRFRLILQQNQGVSVARNVALEATSAPYVTFVDSDDWLYPNHFSELYRLITEHDADMSQVSLMNEYTTHSRERKFVKELKVIDGQPNVVRECVMLREVAGGPCMKLFRRAVITTPFPVGMRFEDAYALAEWAPNMHRIVLSPAMTYHYRLRHGSAVHSFSVGMAQDFLKMLRKREEIRQQYVSDLVPDTWLDYNIAKEMVRFVKNIARSYTDVNQGITEMTNLRSILPPLSSQAVRLLPAKARFRLKLLYKNPAFLARILRITQHFVPHRKKHNRLFS